MKKALFAGLLACLLLLSACGGPQAAPEEEKLHILATTYPVYLFTTAVTEGVGEVEVSLLVNQQTSCLHDYTLTVNDMKAIEAADVIAMNGAGLEDFMADALAASDAAVIDCSEGIDLLTLDGEGEDPHIWMNPGNAAQMIQRIREGLSALDPEHQEQYATNADQTEVRLRMELPGLDDSFAGRSLITFHDGFQYFAQAFDLTILKSIEEEEGSEASARDIKEIVALVEQYQLPAIFTEVNGSDATAQAIARETGVAVRPLNLIMSGEGTGIQPYLDAMNDNLETLVEALG